MKMRLLAAEPEEAVAVAVQRMAGLDLGAMLVIERGRLVGVFSERDLVRRVIAAGLDPEVTPVGTVATPSPVTVLATTPIGECLRLVRARGVRHLPVVDGEGRPVGILSTRDFLQFLLDEREERVDRARGDRRAEGPVDPLGSASESA